MEIPRFPEWGHLDVIDYLALLWPDRSRRAIQSLFALGRIRSGSTPVAARRTVGKLDDLWLFGSLDDVERIPLGPGEEGRGPWPAIIHEDPRIVALSKPSGMPVVPDRTRSGGSCLAFLIRRELDARPRKSPGEFIRHRIVHRIDGLTSGLVLVAKTPEAERQLSADFESHRIRKEYLAILSGCVRPARFSVNCPVIPGRKGKMRAEVSRGAAEAGSALTDFDVLERFATVTLVRARPRTGRTHQIRVHAWAAGHPLAIDPLYGGPAGGAAGVRINGIERLTLHAQRYILPDGWEEPRVFECPPPEDFEAALDWLRRKSSP